MNDTPHPALRNRPRRILPALLLCGLSIFSSLLVFSLAGCGRKEEPPPVVEPGPSHPPNRVPPREEPEPAPPEPPPKPPAAAPAPDGD